MAESDQDTEEAGEPVDGALEPGDPAELADDAEAGVLTLSYELTPSEVRREDLRRGSEKAAWWALAAIPFVGLILLLVSWLQFGDPLAGPLGAADVSLAILALAPAAMFAAVFGSAVWQSQQTRQARDWMFGHVELQVDDEGLMAQGPAGHGEMPWRTVGRVRESPDAFLLYVDPVNRMIVPKRAFEEDEEARFRAMVEEHVQGTF